MKKTILIFIALQIGITAYSQEEKRFEPGSELIEKTIISQINPKSKILFIFKDDTHLVNFYEDLEKKIKKRFRKSKHKISFNYELTSSTPLESDLKSTPQKKYDQIDHDYICIISISSIEGWDDHLLEERKQSYYVNIKMSKTGTNIICVSGKIKVHSTFVISTQNLNTSELIYKLINL
ncbi:hypothetical protein GCM10009430_37440 [Aquimarina litoralis]|uniref:YfiR family protein n=1 Tax=Aquimarina litoralis TaxID=584605 RepID=A0ABN1J5B0_9FLAO